MSSESRLIRAGRPRVELPAEAFCNEGMPFSTSVFPSHCTSTSAGHKGGCPGWIHLGVENGIKDEGPCHHIVYQSSTRQDASGDMRAALLQGDVSISVVRVLVPAGRKV